MKQAGGVFAGGGGQISASGPWSFDLPLSTGTYDLVAVDDYGGSASQGRFAIRRGIELAQPVMLPTIDLDVEGIATAPFGVDVLNLEPDESVSTDVELLLEDGNFARFSRATNPIARIAPRSSLQTESQTFAFEASSNTQDPARIFYRDYTTEVSSDGFETKQLELLPRLLNIGYSELPYLHVSWEQLPVMTFTELRLLMVDSSNVVQIHVSQRWLDAHGLKEVRADTSAPGYDPLWQIVDASGLGLGLTSQTPDGDFLETGFVQNPPAFARYRDPNDTAVLPSKRFGRRSQRRR
ncbi:MAG TPA: hypothetical protein VFQ53_30980 [Kofleriaceae bacterium]|nr:hypothetical protein [Kofleriaceae bacterium]